MRNQLSDLYETADALIKRLSRAVYGDACIVCRRTVWDCGALDPGHFIGRGAMSVRWDIWNVFPQCRVCNHIHTYNEEPMRRAVREILGPYRLEELYRKSNELFDPSRAVMLEVIMALREATIAVENQRRRLLGV